MPVNGWCGEERGQGGPSGKVTHHTHLEDELLEGSRAECSGERAQRGQIRSRRNLLTRKKEITSVALLGRLVWLEDHLSVRVSAVRPWQLPLSSLSALPSVSCLSLVIPEGWVCCLSS